MSTPLSGAQLGARLFKYASDAWMLLQGDRPETAGEAASELQTTLESATKLRAVAGHALALKAQLDFALNINAAFGVLYMIRSRAQRVEMRRTKEELKQVMLSVPYEDFKEAWQTARQLVSLQGRLLLEQCFWELGGRWREELVTGFKPVKPTEVVGPAAGGGAPAPYVLPISKRIRGP